MIPFFVGYGVLMCVLSYRGRRRLSGLLAVVLGCLGLVTLGLVYLQLTRHHEDMRSAATVAGVLYYPYMLMLMLIAGWLFAMPRVSKRKGRCGGCGYDLEDLPPGIERCPECGRRFRGGYQHAGVMAEYQRRKWSQWPSASSSADQSPDASDDQHAERQSEDQSPPEPPQTVRIDRPD
ncbi:MAG: DMT family transporter [Salinibacterium sp.]|nr:DMT family transporter [Salinibacterium sp.]